MPSSFPFPILAVTADVVKDLEGEDVLCGLWTHKVFTKCKESLKDGRRLENISWRLWYREMISTQSSPAPSPNSLSPFLTSLRMPIGHMFESALGAQQIDLCQDPHIASPDMSQTFLPWDANNLASSPLARGRFLDTGSPASAPMDRLDVNSMEKLARKPIIMLPNPIVASLPSVHTPLCSSRLGETSLFCAVVINSDPHPTSPTTFPPSPLHPSCPTAAAHTPTHLSPLQPHPTPPTVPPSPQPLSASSFTPKQSATVQASSTSKASDEMTLKSSDCPSSLKDPGLPGVESPKHVTSKFSETKPRSLSNATSSHAKSAGVCPRAAATKRPRVQVRKSKERCIRVKAGLQRLPSHRPRSWSPSPGPPEKQVSPLKASVGRSGVSQTRGRVVKRTPPAYDPTDLENDSDWSSEADSGGGVERGQTKEGKTKELTAEESRIHVAAEEAQHQRDMFAKVPKRSYLNLNRVPSGLLSQLFNPDASMFPPNRPHRPTLSTQDMTHLAHNGPSPKLQMNPGSVAVPLVGQVTVQAQVTSAGTAVRPRGGYRLKGRPRDEELEDTESEDENAENVIQVSRSLVHQKLAALADPNRRRDSERGGLLSQEALQQHHHRLQNQQIHQKGERPGLTTVAVTSAQITLDYPYNLPAPEPPMTPCTTRRRMLQTELSEALRRNLLWERHVSRGQPRGVLGGSGLGPLTSMNADRPVVAPQPPTTTPATSGDSQVHCQLQGPQNNADNRAERWRTAMARYRGWADDYHYSGW